MKDKNKEKGYIKLNKKHELYKIIQLKVLIELTESVCWLYHYIFSISLRFAISKRVLEGVVEYREVSARLMWVKVKLGG